MPTAKIIANWKKNVFDAVYWLEGEEPFYIDQVVEYAEKHLLAEAEQAFNMTIFYGKDADWAQVINACKRYSVFAEKQVVILKEAQHMGQIEKLLSYIENPLSSTIFIVAHKDKNVDGRSALAKALKTKAVVVSTKKMYDNKLPEWVMTWVSERGYQINAKAVQIIVDHIGNDLNRIQNELEKLIESNRANGHTIKLLFANYPHMPTGQLPEKDFFEQLVAFAKKHDILIVHDNPYSFILNETPSSLLSINGAIDVVLELNSLSKSSNMAGWRVGMLIASKQHIKEVLRFKSNMDSGMFLPLQLAAAKALSLDKDWYDSINKIYRERRTKVFELLDLLKCDYAKDQVGMFVWAKIPAKYKNGYELSDEVLYNSNVFITPGGIFGSAGDNYIRVSLCGSIERFEEAIRRINT
jgi:histidinol-phosphate/aromatic aminotransferase/cobyric acid decarboxylase-like protein